MAALQFPTDPPFPFFPLVRPSETKPPSPPAKSHSFEVFHLVVVFAPATREFEFCPSRSHPRSCSWGKRDAGRAWVRELWLSGTSETTQGRLYANLRQPVSLRNMTARHRHVDGDDLELLGHHHRACDIDTVQADLVRDAAMPSRKASRRAATQRGPRINRTTALVSLLATAPGAMAQGCISLSGSTQCPAFSSASISTNSSLFGFLYVLLPHDGPMYRWLTPSSQSLFAVCLGHGQFR